MKCQLTLALACLAPSTFNCPALCQRRHVGLDRAGLLQEHVTGAQHVGASPQACCRTSSASEDPPAAEASSNGHAPSGPAANGLPVAERAETTLLYVRFRAAAEPGLRGAPHFLLTLLPPCGNSRAGLQPIM